jgi:hypothetical protein
MEMERGGMLPSTKVAAQAIAPAVTAIVTQCQFDLRVSLTAMLRRVRRNPITPWNAVDGNSTIRPAAHHARTGKNAPEPEINTTRRAGGE